MRVAIAVAIGIAIGWFGSTLGADELRDELREKLVHRINEVRTGYGLSPLASDVTASRVAQRLSSRQVYDGTYGHFASDGLAPYHRYSFAGGNDGLQENTASWSADKTYSDSEIESLVTRSLDAMLTETPPEDGHRRTLLDPWATHLGVGIAWRAGEVRITQDFLRRYVKWEKSPPREVSLHERVVLKGSSRSGWTIAAISLHHEDFPKRLRPSEANRIETWDLPPDREDFDAIRVDRTSEIVRMAQAAGGRPGDLLIHEDDSFSFSIPFQRGPGVYTVVVWVRTADRDSPLVSASNISIRVGEPAEEKVDVAR